MSMTEKAAYLKGLAEGMELGDSKNEKLIKAIIDVIDEMAVLVCPSTSSVASPSTLIPDISPFT